MNFQTSIRFPRFTERNCAAVTVATSVRSKLATSLVGSGTPVCACADVHWRHYNSALLISSLTLPTAASKYLDLVTVKVLQINPICQLLWLNEIFTGPVFSKGIEITPEIHIRKFEEQAA